MFFAIGLEELREFSTLQGEGIRDRMFTAGAGATTIPIIDLRRELKESKEKLFTERDEHRKYRDY